MARSLARRIAGRLVRMSGLRDGAVILMYHRIADETYDPWGMAVTPENFAAQLDWLAVHRLVMPLAELIDLHGKGALPKRACSITFDDGYECNALHAAPMLAERNLSATFFLAPRLLDRKREFWWDDLERIIFGSRVETLSLEDGTGMREWDIGPANSSDCIRLPGAPPSTGRQRSLDEIWAFLLPQSPSSIRDHVDTLRAQAGVATIARKTHRPISTEQVAALSADTIAIGAHTLNHISMPDRPLQEQVHEVTQSLKECAAIRGDDVDIFAYPYGHLNPSTIDLVRNAGSKAQILKAACSTRHGAVNRKSNQFALPRIAAGNWDATVLHDQLAKL